MTIPHHASSALNPTMHLNPNLSQSSGPQHFLSSPALASPTGSAGNSSQRPCELLQQPINSNSNMANNTQCPTVYVTNMGHYMREAENKNIYSR